MKLNIFSFQTNLISSNPLTNMKCGTLYNAIAYRRRRRRLTEQSIMNSSVIELPDEQKDKIKAFFRTIVLPVNKECVKQMMSQHKDFLLDLICNSFDEFKSIWSFYFRCPDLVTLFNCFNRKIISVLMKPFVL